MVFSKGSAPKSAACERGMKSGGIFLPTVWCGLLEKIKQTAV
jgi:hypothetical protein